MLGRLGSDRVVRKGPPRDRARLLRSVTVLIAAMLCGFGASAVWQRSGSDEIRSVEASVEALRATIAAHQASVEANLQASEAMRLRLEERVAPAGGVTDQPIDLDEAARLAGLDRRRVPGDAPTWSLAQIDFDPDSDRLKPGAYPELAKLGVLVQLAPKTVIELGGGTSGADPQLAKLRRERVREFLIQHFEIEPERITIASADGPGMGQPLLVRLLR